MKSTNVYNQKKENNKTCIVIKYCIVCEIYCIFSIFLQNLMKKTTKIVMLNFYKYISIYEKATYK